MRKANMNVERLQHLALILRGVRAENFNLDMWRVERDCGTVACAVGWAGQDKQFTKAGFTVTKVRPLPSYRDPRGGERFYGWEAVEQFFGLHPVLALIVFTHTGYTTGPALTPQFVADVIEKVLIPSKGLNDAAYTSGDYVAATALHTAFLMAMMRFHTQYFQGEQA